MQLTMDESIEAVNQTALKLDLSALLALQPEQVTLSLGAGSTVVSVLLTIPAHGGQMSSTEGLAIRAQELDATQLSAIFEVGTWVSEAPIIVGLRNETVTTNVTIMQQKDCPPGHWCTAGYRIPCVSGSYNPHWNNDSQAACTPCPLSSTTLQDASTSINDCACEPGFYNNATGSVQCLTCPIGTACHDRGTTLFNLPLKRGYFRVTNLSADVLRCADAAANCTSDTATTECPDSTSGCLGGPDVVQQCMPGLTSVYCLMCTNTSDHYYVRASKGEYAHCAPCSMNVGMNAGFIVGMTFITVLLMLGAWRLWKNPTFRAYVRRIHMVSKPYSVPNKLKILVGMS
jgi:hypothetical protein